MRFFPKGLKPFKIKKNQIGIVPRIYNSKSRWIWKLGQRENLFHFKLSTNMPRLEFLEIGKIVFCIFEVGTLESI
jgi:hypothetical protein